MDIGILLSFLLFLGFFAGVGLASMRVKQDTTDDYLVAGRGMHPALAALSAVSTWNSGYMFIGFIGFIYLMGYSAIWIGVISTIGQLVAWAWLYKFIQKEGNERGLRSLSSLVSEKAGAPEAKLAAVLSVFFLSIYAAAQLTAGGKALFVMLGWPELVGILIGFVLVVAYCYAGGIRASIWTDAAQSCVMIVGSVILCWVALGNVGGFSGMHTELESQSATLVNFLPTDISLGISLYLLAFFLGGLGVAGQPQVVSRVMTLKSDEDRKQAMIWFFVWQTPFIALMFIVGLASRVLFTDGDFDAELGLPALAMDTLPALGVGMILASIFAATMSTADSQVLACTAAITDDIKPEWREDHKTTKKVTLYVAAAATMISIGGLYVPGGDSVFALVVLAVYGLGGIFVPLLIIRWMGYKPDTFHSIAMMISAFSGVIVWTFLGLGGDVFPSVPGVGSAFIAHFIMCAVREDSASNPFGRFEISQDRQRQFTTVGIIALCFIGVAEGAYAVYGPDSGEDSDENRVAMYQIDGNFTLIEIGSGTEVISDTAQVTASSDAVDLSGLNVVGFQMMTSHTDNEQPCNGAASTEDDEVTYNGGIKEIQVTNSGTQQNLESSGYWIDNDIIGSTTNSTSSEINQLLDGGDFGIGEYEFTISVTVNDGGAELPFPPCSNGDSDESVDWTISLITLDYTLTEVKS
jgi:sodium/proline symporter